MATSALCNLSDVYVEEAGFGAAVNKIPFSSPKQPELENVEIPTLVGAIEAAYLANAAHVLRTPTIRIPWLDAPGRKVWAKLESHQISGSFKYRGAINALKKHGKSIIVTASAGNHALATVAAAEKLGRQAELFVPTTASEIKVNRLAGQAKLTLMGRDLYEATLAAKGYAQSVNNGGSPHMYYLSPYADFDVVVGAGTVMPEAIADAGPFDYVIVPLGGGGLAAAVGAYCSSKSPETQVICSHPQIFGRDYTSITGISSQLKRPVEASLSDGLGVQLVEDTPFAKILDSTISEVVQVSETLTAASISYLIRLQSLMIEGAAATTVAALLADPEGLKYKGSVLILLTGGNITANAVAKALVADIEDASVRQRLGLRHILDPLERNGAVQTFELQTALTTNTRYDNRQMWLLLAKELNDTLAKTWNKHQQMLVLVQQLALETDEWSSVVFEQLHQQLAHLLDDLLVDIKAQHRLTSWRVENRFRIALQLHTVLASMLEKASASYDQSSREWFFDTSAQNSAAVNYDRYGAQAIRTRERHLLQNLQLSRAEPIELLLTSSGMAAYQTIQLYLLKQLRVGDAVVLPPYIYFEALEQLTEFPHIRTYHSQDYQAHSIIEEAEARDARVVFVDPVANIVGLPVCDIRLFLETISKRPGWDRRIVVIDGTMISGGMPVYDWLQGPYQPELIYYESGSKYMQLGLDIQMAGLLVYPSHLDGSMRTIRRNAGTILYLKGLLQMPQITFEILQSRNTLLSNNAEFLYGQLQRCLGHVANVRYPREWQDYAWRHGGCLVTIDFHSKGLNNKESLEACIDLILRTAENHKVPITKGVSFGFSTSRVSAASSMAKDSDPFLRLAVGVEAAEVELLAVAIEIAICKYVARFGAQSEE